MIHEQFVHLGDRAFVFGGAYGNLQAAEAVLNEAKRRGFKSEQIIFTGDLVAYCAQPQETTDLIRASGCHIIMGNCEESLGSGADDCGCGFEEGSACSVLSDEWYRFCQANLDQETMHWMGTLPKSMNVQIGQHRFLVTHGTPEQINQFVFPSDIEAKRYHLSNSISLDGYIVGHSGLPFVGKTQHGLWINSGAAGMPANDGTRKIWCAALESDGETFSTELIALDYDQQKTADRMTEAGLANGYRDCLTSGIWPSHDVLPEEEKALTGIELQPKSVEVTSVSTP